MLLCFCLHYSVYFLWFKSCLHQFSVIGCVSCVYWLLAPVFSLPLDLFEYLNACVPLFNLKYCLPIPSFSVLYYDTPVHDLVSFPGSSVWIFPNIAHRLTYACVLFLILIHILDLSTYSLNKTLNRICIHLSHVIIFSKLGLLSQ